MITTILNDDLRDIEYETHPIFGLNMPKICPNVPSKILNPINTWEDKEKYSRKVKELALAFNKNFEQFARNANEEILSSAPLTIIM